MTIKDLYQDEYNDYYNIYIRQLDKDILLLEAYKTGKTQTVDFFNSIPKEKLDTQYAENKWTPKEILQHLIDTERIFSYRLFRIARRDKTALASFDQNMYNDPSGADKKDLSQLISEYNLNRENTISLIASLSVNDLKQVGTSSGEPMSAAAAAFIIPGHDIWHIKIIKERYL